MAPLLVEVKGVSKRFGPVRALRSVDFNLRPGEVHALIGENGAGKTTLMMILSGVYRPDEGEIRVDGEPVTLLTPVHAQRAGIATVFQEFSLVPVVSVAENIFMNRAPVWGPARMLRRGALNQATTELLSELNVRLDPDAPVDTLSTGARQLVEIAKALSLHAKVLLLDEPTSALNKDEAQALLSVVRRLSAQGMGIVIITHRLADALEVADRFTILKDGQMAGTFLRDEVNAHDLVMRMVGRDVQEGFRASRVLGEVVLEARGITAPAIDHVSLSVHAGEVVGVAGLQGSGKSELGLALSGAAPVVKGEIRFQGNIVHWHHPADAVAAGIGYLPPDRKRDGLFLEQPVRENVTVSILRELSQFGFMRSRPATRLAEDYRDRLSIRAPSVATWVSTLSGGNQQKVMVARWLAADRRVLIVDDPTVGIDTGAKAEIHRILTEVAGHGVAVVLISSELPELLGLADRIVVMRAGRVVGEVSGDEASEELVMRLATQTA